MKVIDMYRRELSSSRDPDRPVSTVVLHATVGLNLGGILSTFEGRKVSAHYIIKKDGTIVKVVPLDRAAWHAGSSLGPDGPHVNDYSIGIEIVNKNDGKDPYPEVQRYSVGWLLEQFPKQFPGILYLTDHYQICTPKGRKSDPRGFPTILLAQKHGYEYWERGGPIDMRPGYAT